MKHLEISAKGKNSVWRYLVMIIAVFLASNVIGAIPLIILYVIRAAGDPEVATAIASGQNMMDVLGLSTNAGLIVMLVPFLFGLAAFIMLTRPLNERSPMEVVNGGTGFRWKKAVVAGILWIILGAVYLFISVKTDPGNFTINNDLSGLPGLVLIAVVLIPFQGAFEEVIFRGYLMQGFSNLVRNRLFPLVMTSLFFALLHAFNPEVKAFGFWTMMPQYITFGLVFGILTIIDDGVEAAIGAHAANNIFLSIMVSNESSALQTGAIFRQHAVQPWSEFTSLIISGIVFLVLYKLIMGSASFGTIFRKITFRDNTNQIPYTEV